MSATVRSKDMGLSKFLTAATSGVKKASEAVKMMSASEVRLDILSAGIAPTSRLAEVAGRPDDLMVGVYIGVTGDIPGHALLVFPYESAVQLVDMLMGQPLGTTTQIDEMTQSVLQEVGNIVTSSYLTALSDFYHSTMLPCPPSVAIDMAAAIFDSVLLNTGHYDEDTISIVTRFAGSTNSLRGFFLYIPELSMP